MRVGSANPRNIRAAASAGSCWVIDTRRCYRLALMTAEMKGRSPLVAAAALLAVFALSVAPACSRAASDGGGAREELLARLAKVKEPQRFAFKHAAGGTRVNDCFLANRRFSGVVDRGSAVLEIRGGADSDRVIAVVTTERILLHQSLFAAGLIEETWLQVPRPLDRTWSEALGGVLGTDLAGYVISDGLPPTGLATVRAALEVAAEVTVAAGERIRGEPTERFHITVDEERYEAASIGPRPAPSEASQAERLPVIDVWAGSRGAVLRVSVQPEPTSGEDEASPEEGWIVDYLESEEKLTGTTPGAVVDIGAIDLSALAAAPTDCSLPV